MTDRSNERSKRKAEYDKVYQKRKRSARNEYMRLYRARKKKERLDAGDAVGTSFTNDDPPPVLRIYTEMKTPALKPTNIGIDSQDDHQYELHQTPTLSVPQTSNINTDQFASNNLTKAIHKFSTWVSHERDEIYDRYWFSARKKMKRASIK